MGSPNFANLVRVSEGWKKPGAEMRGLPYIEPIRMANTRVFTVQWSTFSADNPLNATVANDGNGGVIPALGSFWGSAAPYLVCRRVRTLDPQNPFVNRVVCEYSGESSPLLMPPVLREGGRRHEEEVGYDAMGKPFINTMGRRLSGMTRPFFDKLWSLTRNEPTDAFVGGDWRGVVNAATLVLGSQSWGPKKVCIENITSSRLPAPPGLLTGALTISSITLSGGAYTVNVSAVGLIAGTQISVGDGAGNSIAGTVASGSGSQALVLSTSGLTVMGDPTLIPSGTALSFTAPTTGISYYWPVTYELGIRTHVIAFNGNPPTDIGWQRLIENHGSSYRQAPGGLPTSTFKPPMCLPDVLLHQDGTEWNEDKGDTQATLYWLLFDIFATADFAALALGV